MCLIVAVFLHWSGALMHVLGVLNAVIHPKVGGWLARRRAFGCGHSLKAPTLIEHYLMLFIVGVPLGLVYVSEASGLALFSLHLSSCGRKLLAFNTRIAQSVCYFFTPHMCSFKPVCYSSDMWRVSPDQRVHVAAGVALILSYVCLGRWPLDACMCAYGVPMR